MALLGATITIVTLGWYMTRLSQGVPANMVRTETFTLLAICEWMNVLGCRARTRSAFRTPLRRNPWLLAGLGVGVLLQIAVVQWRPLGAAFHTVPLSVAQWAAIALAGSTVLVVDELRKAFLRRRAAG
jgi:magnesium-transporting ATPase (P-type)